MLKSISLFYLNLLNLRLRLNYSTLRPGFEPEHKNNCVNAKMHSKTRLRYWRFRKLARFVNWIDVMLEESQDLKLDSVKNHVIIK